MELLLILAVLYGVAVVIAEISPEWLKRSREDSIRRASHASRD